MLTRRFLRRQVLSNLLAMIVENNGVVEVPAVDVPIVVEIDHTGVVVVGTCMVACSRTFLCGIDFFHDSTGLSFHIATCDSNNSSVKGFSKDFVVDICRCTSVSSLSPFFVLLVLLEV
jgi:hypothetical protein